MVTGWASGTGPQAFADLAADSGRCVWLDPVTEVAAPSWHGDDVFLASTTPVLGSARAIAVQRVGDLLVGVTAYSDAGDAAAQVEALRVSDLVVDELIASGLPPPAADRPGHWGRAPLEPSPPPRPRARASRGRRRSTPAAPSRACSGTRSTPTATGSSGT